MVISSWMGYCLKHIIHRLVRLLDLLPPPISITALKREVNATLFRFFPILKEQKDIRKDLLLLEVS